MPLSGNVGTIVTYDDLDPIGRSLIDEANNARKYAYCPFSRFSVGSCVAWIDSDSIDSGVNVENSSYGDSLCAERTAVAKGVAQGKRRVKAVAVVAEMSNNNEYVMPCGLCRQFIYEFGDDVDIFSSRPSDLHGKVMVIKIKELLPLGFRL